jgi:RNA polymerase sigma-70 factor (ECF subfamily)
MVQMEMDDAAAVAEAQAGNRDAFRLLVERHSRGIFRLGFRMTGNEADAEEVVQESLLRAYRSLGRFQARSSFSTWLHRIAANCALDLLARRKQEPQPSPEPPEGEPEEAPEERLVSDNPGPERQLLGRELQERIGAAMQQLTPVERTAFVLRHFEGRSIEEISTTLELRAGAAKNTIFRAVQKMRRALEPMRASR